MAEKNIKSRIVHKHDTAENWSKAVNFIPKQGELIVYDIDSTYDYERIKIGDGVTKVNSLPFANDKIIVDNALSSSSENPVQNKVVNTAISSLQTLVGDTTVAAQISDAVASKADKTHTHNYAGSSSAGGAAKVSESDIGITTEGTGSAYTATVSGITALTAGVSFVMIPHVVSTSTAPTLNVNGLGAKSIKRRLSSLSTSAQVGYTATWLTKGVPFRVTYDGTQWIVEGLTKPAVADLHGTLAVDKGGTGATTAESARTNLGITPANIGAAASSHTHNYLPLTGGTLTGSLTVNDNIYGKGTLVSQTNSYPGLTIQNASGANLAMLYSNGTNGGYSNTVLRVYSSASEYSSFSFGKDGTLELGGVFRSGNHDIKGNSYPVLSFTDLSVTKTYAYLQPQTSAGEYADVLLAVKNSSGQSNFLFAMNGNFTAPSDIISNGGILKSSRNTNPCFAMTNQNGAWLASLVAVTSDGSYGNAQLAVYKSATEGSTFTFSNQGSFRAPSTVYSSLFAVQSNNNPQLMLQNASGAPLGMLYMNTATGGYSSAYLRVYSSASAYSTFNFGNDGKLSCGSLALTTALPISSGGTGSTTASGALTNLGALSTSGGTVTGILSVNNTLYGETIQTINEYVGMYENNKAGKIDIGNATYGDWTTIACSDDGSVSINNMLRATALRVDGQNDWPSLYFKCSSKTNPGVLLQASSNHGFGIYCYGSDLDSASTRYYEGYTFPAPATGLTANKNYTVYSEKNIIYSSSQPTGVKGAIWLKPV